MRKTLSAMLRLIARLSALCCASLFVPVTVLLLLLLNIDHTLLNAGPYKRALSREGFYEALPALVADQFSTMESFLADPCREMPLGCRIDGASPELQACLTDALGEDALVAIGSGRREPSDAELAVAQPCLDRFSRPASGDDSTESASAADARPSFMDALGSDDWQSIISYLLPPSDLRQMVETGLDRFFAYLDGGSDSVKLPLTAIKARLRGANGEEFIRFLLSTQPACSGEQLAQIEAGDFGGEGEPTLLCNANGEALEKLLVELQGQLEDALLNIPEEATLIGPLPVAEASTPRGPFDQNPLAALRMIRAGLRFSPLLACVLLLVALFDVRSMKGWLRWWGIPVLIASLIAFGLGLLAIPGLEWMWAEYALPRLPPMFSEEIAGLGHDIVRSLAGEFALWLSGTSAILALLALAAVAGSSRLGRAPDTDSAPGS